MPGRILFDGSPLGLLTCLILASQGLAGEAPCSCLMLLASMELAVLLWHFGPTVP